MRVLEEYLYDVSDSIKYPRLDTNHPLGLSQQLMNKSWKIQFIIILDFMFPRN